MGDNTKSEPKKKYKAFISYRHLEPDALVAEKLQVLLENYKPPKPIEGDIGRLFRDRTELPLSGDLDQALKDALLSSEYLIVIVSPRLKESKWCMEEIRAFKEADGGRIRHILPVLVDGEPQDVLPDELKWEEIQEVQPDGTVRSVLREVEPLCCDVRGLNNRERMKNLKTEFLRIAAPMLNCGYDDLFQRHLRRQRRQRTLLLGSTITVLTIVLATVAWFYIQARIARDRFQENLTDNYIRQGAREENEGDLQRAVMYYAGALSLDAANTTAATGALLSLQEKSWLIADGKTNSTSESGTDQALSESGATNDTNIDSHIENENSEETFQDPESDLDYFAEAYYEDVDLSIYGDRLRFYYDEPLALYGSDKLLVLYDDATRRIIAMYRSTERNSFLNSQDYGVDTEATQPLAYPVFDDEVLVEYGGYLYLYHIGEKNDDGIYLGNITDIVDLHELFCCEDSEELQPDNLMWVDRATGLVVINDGGYKTASIDLAKGTLNSLHTRYNYFLENVAFLPDGKGFALLYGNSQGISPMNMGGFVEVYSRDGKLVSRTETDESFVPKDVVFSKDGMEMAVLCGGSLSVFDTNSGKQTCATLFRDDMVSASFTDNSHISVHERSGSDTTYRIITAEAEIGKDDKASEGLSEKEREYSLKNGLTLSHNYRTLTVQDREGGEVSRLRLPLAFNRLTFRPDMSVCYLWYPGREDLCRIFIDPEKGTLQGLAVLRTLGNGVQFVCTGDSVASVVTTDNHLMTFPVESDRYTALLSMERTGTIKRVADDGGSLVAILIEQNVYDDPEKPNWDYNYHIELWDVKHGIHLGDPVQDGVYLPGTIYFSGDYFFFETIKELNTIRVSAAGETEGFRELISGISCLELGEQQESIEKLPVLEGTAEDALKTLFPAYDTINKVDVPAGNSLIDYDSLESVLDNDGSDAWLERVDQVWWKIENDKTVSLSEQKEFFEYCLNRTAPDKMETLATAFQVFSDAVAADGNAFLDIYYMLSKGIDAILASTDQMDGLIADYFQKETNTNLMLIEEDLQRFLSAVNYRFIALYLSDQWHGVDALKEEFGLSDDLWEVLRTEGITILPELAAGNVNKAVESFKMYLGELEEQLYNQSEEERIDLVKELITDAWLYSQHGSIKEEDVQHFCELLQSELGYRMGVSLESVSLDDLKSGFRLGDVIESIGDTMIVSPVQAKILSGKASEDTLYFSRKSLLTGKRRNYRIPNIGKIPGMDGELVLWK